MISNLLYLIANCFTKHLYYSKFFSDPLHLYLMTLASAGNCLIQMKAHYLLRFFFSFVLFSVNLIRLVISNFCQIILSILRGFLSSFSHLTPLLNFLSHLILIFQHCLINLDLLFYLLFIIVFIYFALSKPLQIPPAPN